jgi:hypothetical protein
LQSKRPNSQPISAAPSKASVSSMTKSPITDPPLR